MKNNRFLSAFNIVENFKDIYQRPEQRFTAVDGVRACSILYVFFYHCLLAVFLGYETEIMNFVQQTPWYFQWALMGDRGVDSFFVISGFLIGQMLFKEHKKKGAIDLKRFYIRRILRLAPTYYLIIALFTVSAGPSVIQKIMNKTSVDVYQATLDFYQHMLAFAFYVNNFLSMQNSHILWAWSLAIEEQFYLCFGLLLVFGFYRIKNRLMFLLLLYLASFVIRAGLFLFHPELLVTGDVLQAGPAEICESYWEIFYDNLYTRFGSIMPGIILAYLYVYHWPAVERFMTVVRSNMMVIVALFLVIFTSVFPVYTWLDMPVSLRFIFHVCHRNIYALSVGLLILVMMFPYGLGGMLHKVMSLKLFYPVSQLSYSMYLVHIPIVLLIGFGLRAMGFIPELNFPNLFIVALAGFIPVLSISAILFVLVERPFMKMRKSKKEESRLIES